MQQPENIQQYLDALSRLRVSDGQPLVSLILFGSAARGGFAPQISDIDLIVVLPDSASRADKAKIRQETLALEIAHGFREPPRRNKSWLEKFAERASGHAMSGFVCSRGDLLSGEVARVLDLSRLEAMFVDRIVFASVLVSAKTVWGEDLLPLAPIHSLRRLDVFKALFSFVNVILMSAEAFPVLPDATRYAMGTLKHSLHCCYFCYHLRTAPLPEEIAFFHSRLGRGRILLELLEQRRLHRRSFSFVLRCLPVLFRLHFQTAWDNRFPRTPVRTAIPPSCAGR